MKKILGYGILAGILILVIAMAVDWIFQQISPNLVEQYTNPGLFRSMSDPLMKWFYLYYLILGVALAWWWNMSKAVMNCDCKRCNLNGQGCCRGMKFGIVYFIIATLPGMFMTYVSMPVSFMLIVSWSVGGLLSVIAAGLLLSKLNK
jgi:hypothetical protein